jgi:antitoxin (DNA-binding transcriptional repressor) of toxin-antitoxin stability system
MRSWPSGAALFPKKRSRKRPGKPDIENAVRFGMLNDGLDVIAAPEMRWIMNVAEAEKNFTTLVNKVYVEGISVDLERDNKVIARLTPAEPRRTVTVGELSAFLRSLPSLGDDADDFSRDVRAIRSEVPPEGDPWD